jgi:hypothetical protein
MSQTKLNPSQIPVVALAGGLYPPGTTGQYWRGDNSWQTLPTISPSALTKVDDTNVTLTLGGTPATSLLAAVSLTLGWTGTLADSRIASAATWNAKEPALGNPGVDNYVLASTAAGVRSWIANGAGSMIYPAAGIAVSTSSAWTTSIDPATLALVGQTMYIGTTAVAINRGTGTLNLAGIGTLDTVGEITAIVATEQAKFSKDADNSIAFSLGAALTQVTMKTATNVTWDWNHYGTTSPNGAFFRVRGANGTASSPTASKAGDIAFGFQGGGHTGSIFGTNVDFRFFIGEDWSATNHGTYLSFRTTKNGAGEGISERFRIDVYGNTVITGNFGANTTMLGSGVTYQSLNTNGNHLFVGADSSQESPMFQIVPSYVVSTHASYTSRTIFSQWAIAGAQETMRMESGAAAMIGFLGANAVIRQTGCAVPTDLASSIASITALRTALNNLGLTTVV